MLRDIASVIAGMLSTWDIQECRRVSKQWHEVFELDPVSVYPKDSGWCFRRGMYKATLSEHGLTYKYGDISYTANSIWFGNFNVRGHSTSNVIISTIRAFDALVNVFGDTLAELPVFRSILVIPSDIDLVKLPDDDVETNHNGYMLKVTGCYLEIQVNTPERANIYMLYTPSYALSVFQWTVANTGFIRIGGRIWCADAADVAAVGALADNRRVYVHVLTSVYFCRIMT